MAEPLRRKTPSERYEEATREEEIGSTSGTTHDDLLARTLGRERGLDAATGVAYEQPEIVERKAAARPTHAVEGGAGRDAPVPPNEEINEKKIERHGDIGGAA
jgi:hypothetical protein